jgi:hypothetical protein
VLLLLLLLFFFCNFATSDAFTSSFGTICTELLRIVVLVCSGFLLFRCVPDVQKFYHLIFLRNMSVCTGETVSQNTAMHSGIGLSAFCPS